MLRDTPEMKQEYAALGSRKEKEQFRLKWLDMQTTAKRSSQATESTSKLEKLKSSRDWLTASQVRSHYKSRKTATKHISFCKAHASTHVKFSKMIGENLYLVISVKGSSESQRSWDMSTSWQDCCLNVYSRLILVVALPVSLVRLHE